MTVLSKVLPTRETDCHARTAKKIVEISDDIVIIAVADGHGSEKCPRSDRGSTIAVNTFCEVMNNYLQSYGSDENGLSNLITFLNREGDMRFAQDICEEWQARVKAVLL